MGADRSCLRCHPAFMGLILAFLFDAVLAHGQEPVPVIVREVAATSFVDRVEALGTLRANESVQLTATVTDTVTAIHFEDGERVEAKQILIEMTSEEEHALLEEESSTLAEAKKQLERVQPLVERGAAAQSLLDQRRREYDTARARLHAIESRLRDRLIIAPFAGVVGLRTISVGALIEPGDVITTLDDDSVMKLDFTVPAIYLSTLRIGLPVEARAPAFGDRIFRGTVSSIDSRIDRTSRSILARAIIANPDLILKPGLLMSVELLNNPRETLAIPEEALIPSGPNNHVLVVNHAAPPVAERREVVIGSRRPGEVEIVSGLTAGDLVVVHGTLRAQPGQEVAVIAEERDNETLEQVLRRVSREATR